MLSLSVYLVKVMTICCKFLMLYQMYNFFIYIIYGPLLLWVSGLIYTNKGPVHSVVSRE